MRLVCQFDINLFYFWINGNEVEMWLAEVKLWIFVSIFWMSNVWASHIKLSGNRINFKPITVLQYFMRILLTKVYHFRRHKKLWERERDERSVPMSFESDDPPLYWDLSFIYIMLAQMFDCCSYDCYFYKYPSLFKHSLPQCLWIKSFPFQPRHTYTQAQR